MSDLKTQAAELGIKVDGRWSDDRIQAEIDKALEAPPRDPLGHDGDGKKGGAKPATLSVFLDYDTWINDVRIVADPNKAQDIPRDRAKELLNIGKARRADPLPGE